MGFSKSEEQTIKKTASVRMHLDIVNKSIQEQLQVVDIKDAEAYYSALLTLYEKRERLTYELKTLERLESDSWF